MNKIRSFFATLGEKCPLWYRAAKQWLHDTRIRIIYAHRLHPRLVYLWCFLTPALLMTAMHAFLGVYPFGTMSVLTLDLNAQYVFFFEALREWVWGDGSLLYSFSRSLGGEFLGIYAYYLASPLSFIVALFPKENITEALYLMFVLKAGLCGLTFGLLVRIKDRIRGSYAVIFSTTYALIAYATIMQHNTMWFDNMILLPLIVLGLWQLTTQKKYLLYTLSLAVAIFSNFYIGYMMCIFVFFFAFCQYFAMTPAARNPKGERLHFSRAFIRIGFFSIIAVCIAAIIILPAYYALSFGKTEFTTPNYATSARFTLIDLFKQFLPFSYDTVRPEGLPIVYCGTLTLLLLPVYYVSKRLRAREKFCYSIMVLVLMFSMSVNTIDMIWHGFQAPNWLNYRYSFMLCFVLVYMASRAMTHIKSASPKTVAIGCVVYLLLVAVADRFGSKTFRSFTLIGSLLFFALYTGLLIALIARKHRPQLRKLKTALILVVCVEMLLGGVYDLLYLWEDVGMSDRASYANYLAEWRPIIDYVKESDQTFYRMEKLPYRRMNDPSGFAMRGVTASTSTLHADTIAFIEYMGISADSHWSEYAGSSPVTDSILGIKYVFEYADQKRLSDTYTLVAEDGTHHAWLNPYALPIAFCVSPDLNTISFNPDDPDGDGRVHYNNLHSVFDRMNVLVTAMTGAEDLLEIYVPFTNYTVKEEGVASSYAGNHNRYFIRDFVEGKSGTITYTLTGVDDREIFAYFPSQHMRDGNYVAFYRSNGQLRYLTSWFNNSLYGTLHVGKLEENESVKMELTVAGKDGLYYVQEDYVDSYFYSLNEELYRSAFSSLQKNGLVIKKFSEHRFEGTIVATEDKPTVMTTIPFDEGWQVKVDGKAVEVYETLDALLAFDVGPGEHTVEMRYMPKIYKTAFLLFIGGVSTLGLVCGAEYVCKLIRKKKSAELTSSTEKTMGD